MTTVHAPPGHIGLSAVLITAALNDYTIKQATGTEPVLTLADGTAIKSIGAIIRFVASSGTGSSLYPAGNNTVLGQIDQWVDAACGTMLAAQPLWDASSTSVERDVAQSTVSRTLEALEAHLTQHTYLAAERVTLAEVAFTAVLHPLYQKVLGAASRVKLPALSRWLTTCTQLPKFAAVLGPLSLCDAGGAWAAPAAPAGKAAASSPAAPQASDAAAAAAAPSITPGPSKKDKYKKAGAAAGPAAAKPAAAAPAAPAPAANGGAGDAADDEELDPEKKAKKAAKAAEKAAKAAKLAAKNEAAAAAKAAAAAGGDTAGSDKKAKIKEEAEAKKAAEAAEVAQQLAAARATPSGTKKDMKAAMPKAYHPKVVEAAWYEWWEAAGYFKPEDVSTKPPFVIVIPPPNVTGALHIGHALTNAVQDTIVRWRRMSGYNVLWVPGTDHAGIATQTVVEKKLQREQKLSRHDLGREKFVEQVWKWVGEYGDRICDQLRRLGSSVDWSRKVFTMDDTLSRAVLEAFVQMHEQGIVYRDNRLVNWDCTLKTAVSDIEVDYIDVPSRQMLSVPGYKELVEFGVLTSFAYPLEEGGGEIVVATTRPETMLGDTAVAVHPDDARYKDLHGRFVIHPVDGRRIPIITDAELVDMSFGTGAVKITPAHDPNDFTTGKRHNLEFINIFDDNGAINERGGQFAGQPRFKARVTVVEFLTEKGLFRGKADNAMRLGLCSRSKDVIEPVLKPQWWVSCKDMAARSCQAVRDGTLEILPKEFEAVWFRWLENIRDWCISRQLWWGHRIPAFYVSLDGEAPGIRGSPGAPSENMTRWVVGRTQAEAEASARAKFPGQAFTLVQDEDVLDTWFSSGLFPFSVMKWPEQTTDLQNFYPGALLETGHDILFFWVARMVMMGLQLTGQVPFKQVYLHAMVRDAHGRKMSKSLGNVIDPLHVIEGISLKGLHETLVGGNLDGKEFERAKAGQSADYPDGIDECGTDALRFALVAYTTQARDINLDIKRVVAYRHWCNKLWNAIRFAMMNLPADFVPADRLDVATFPVSCQWVLSRLNGAVAAVVKALESYDFATATQRTYAFWQYDICDVFIETMKPVMAFDDAQPALAAAKAATRNTLWTCLEAGLRLLHPFMPFVTEELWQRLPKRAGQAGPSSIMLAPYPVVEAGWDQPQLEQDYEYLNAVVNKVRALRADYGLVVRQRPPLYITSNDALISAWLSKVTLELSTLAFCDPVEVLSGDATAPAGCSVSILDEHTTLHLALQGVLDPALEVQKLDKKVKEAEQRVEALKKRMAMPGYDTKTPENIRKLDVENQTKLETELAKLQEAAQEMRKLLPASK